MVQHPAPIPVHPSCWDNRHNWSDTTLMGSVHDERRCTRCGLVQELLESGWADLDRSILGRARRLRDDAKSQDGAWWDERARQWDHIVAILEAQ